MIDFALLYDLPYRVPPDYSHATLLPLEAEFCWVLSGHTCNTQIISKPIPWLDFPLKEHAL